MKPYAKQSNIMSETSKIPEDKEIESNIVSEKHLRNIALRRLMSSSSIVQDELLEAMTEKTCSSNCGHDHHGHHHHDHYEDAE